MEEDVRRKKRKVVSQGTSRSLQHSLMVSYPNIFTGHEGSVTVNSAMIRPSNEVQVPTEASQARYEENVRLLLGNGIKVSERSRERTNT